MMSRIPALKNRERMRPAQASRHTPYIIFLFFAFEIK
jgi:hypothetical protein